MPLKATLAAGLLALGMATSAYAAPSIDFVDKDDAVPTYSSVRCTAVHSNGLAYRAASRQLDKVAAVPLADLLAGDPGRYTAECTVSVDSSHERYQAKFDAVKLKRGDQRNEAPEYDEEGFGYGIKTPLSETRNRCYDTHTRQINQACLDDYYGNGRYFLDAYATTPDVTFNGNREYSSNVGIFLKENPRHPEEQTQRKVARNATSMASPFQ